MWYTPKMKIQVVTVGKPKLAYGKLGFEEYFLRLSRLHTVQHTVIADKYAYNAEHILEVTKGTTRIVLEIVGAEYTSEQLAGFLLKRELESRGVSFIIGGPEGLPAEVRKAAQHRWSLGPLTLPHDLAMVVTLEALYRASTINAHLPYHK